jgi:hypothetical protein
MKIEPFISGISSLGYCGVLCPLLDELEIIHFSAPPYCVAISPHAFTGLPYLQVWDFRMCIVLSHI